MPQENPIRVLCQFSDTLVTNTEHYVCTALYYQYRSKLVTICFFNRRVKLFAWTDYILSTNLSPPCELLAKEQAIFRDRVEENSHSHEEFSPAFMQSKPNFPVTEQKALYMIAVSHACYLKTSSETKVKLNWGLEQQLMQSLQSLSPKQQKKVLLKTFFLFLGEHFGLYNITSLKLIRDKFEKLLWTCAVILQNTTKA